MFRTILPALIALAVALPASAGPAIPGHDAARAMGESVFQALDLDHSGTVTQDEMLTVGDRIFQAMDIDASDGVSRDEMVLWEDGMAELAAFRGRSQAHDAAMGVVFDLFDADGDAGLTVQEHRDALSAAREKADADHDGLLSSEEFRRGFIFSVALRNALEEPR